jgi:hypothetical protein
MAETPEPVAGSLTGDRLARSVGQKIRYAKVRLHGLIDVRAERALIEIRMLAILARAEIGLSDRWFHDRSGFHPRRNMSPAEAYQQAVRELAWRQMKGKP